MRIGKFRVVAAVLVLTFTGACGQNGKGKAKWDGRYYLVDQRTQMPVANCKIPSSWMAGGKTTWTSEPSMPVSWYIWTMRPDQRAKVFVSSPMTVPSLGRLRQSQYLQSPSAFAKLFVSAAQKDHRLSDVRIADAKFIPHQVDKNLLNTRMEQARQRGIQLTNYFFSELVIRYEGKTGQEKRTATVILPLLALESKASSMSYTTGIELMMPMSYSCPAGEEEATQKVLSDIISGFQLNPNFTSVVNHISAQRTANWLRVQNEIRNKQMEAASSTSATMDRVRDKWSEYIRDVDSVQNPNTGEKMFVDSRYDHAWINNENEVIYHNSGFNTPNASTATFDPNSNALFNKYNWKQLK